MVVKISDTVEPPNKGHFGNRSFVLCSEVVPILEVFNCIIFNNNIIMAINKMHDCELIEC